MAIRFDQGSESKKPTTSAKPTPSKKTDIGMSRSKRGRPKTGNAKVLVSLRLDADVVEAYKATGKGWRSRINDDLRNAKGLPG
ncbi:BrnA antitoxin family protein [Martelella limonii]|uniref:BrnA antitoxin family protein n=1 Tax=Martelella limonii TaxID=1647649 RepID=UPI0015808F14|nr:BrnA antitoxin family protein [Martelella limonii]